MIVELSNKIKENFNINDLNIQINSRGIAFITGEAESWEDLVKVGQLVGSEAAIRNVVNHMTVKGLPLQKADYSDIAKKGMEIGVTDNVDVVIIGAGISGCGIARELSKYPLDILVVEKGDDVAVGASKANNGDIHPGNAVKPGTLKAKLNIRGNRLYDKWAEELDFTLVRCGSMRVATEESQIPMLDKEWEVATKNGVHGAERISGERAMEMEAEGFAKLGVTPIEALWFPSMGVVEPYKVCVALGENAVDNGCKFRFNCAVGDVLTENGTVTGVVTNKGIIKAKYVINAAGLYADEISALAGDECYTIHPRQGTIAILDHNQPPLFNAIVSMMGLRDPKKNVESKGGGMCLTPERHILLGPSATEIPDKSDVSSTASGFDYAMHRNFNPSASAKDIIRIFAGNRPADYKEDFFIEMSPITHGFINVGGIQSPGLASAPAIAEMVESILLNDLKANGETITVKADYNPIRKGPVDFDKLTHAEQNELIKKNPAYGHIVCRCELVTEGEIVDAIHSSLPPLSLDGLKRRVRAGMGRCQAGFCQPRVIEIFARELGVLPSEINLNGTDSNVLIGENRDSLSLKEVQK